MNELIQFDELKTKLAILVQPVLSLEIKNKEAQMTAQGMFREIKLYKNMIEDKRKVLIGPISLQIDKINEYAKTIKEPLLDAEKNLEAKLLEWNRVLEKEQADMRRIEREAQAKREAEAAALIKEKEEEAKTLSMFESCDQKKTEIEHGVAREKERIEFETKKAHWDVSKEIKENKVSGLTTRWTHEIADESLVPREFMTFDAKKARDFYMKEIAIAKANKVKDFKPKIPGLNIFQSQSISGR